MVFSVCVLGSGSSGNATLIETSRTRLFIDMGFSLDDMRDRLSKVERPVEGITHLLLTHCHSDHIGSPGLRLCNGQPLSLLCHSSHEEVLSKKYGNARRLREKGLISHFDEGAFWVGDLCITPLEVPHDDKAKTFGFTVTLADGERSFKASFLTDLGHAPEHLMNHLVDSDLLAIEHNYDPDLLWNSGRPHVLKKRIRGPSGHLSNEQGSQLLTRICRGSRLRQPRHVILMHVSKECNAAERALKTAQDALHAVRCGAALHLASQDEPTRVLSVYETCDNDVQAQLALL